MYDDSIQFPNDDIYLGHSIDENSEYPFNSQQNFFNSLVDREGEPLSGVVYDPIILNKEKKSQKLNINSNNIEKNSTQENTSKGESLPEQYKFSKIIEEIFPNFISNILFLIVFSLKPTPNIENFENKISNENLPPTKKKRKRDKKPKIKEAKKIGRKKKEDTMIHDHNKNSEDNIIKKIKAKITNYLINFINKVINLSFSEEKIKSYIKKIKDDKEPEKEDLIKILDYDQTINMNKKEQNLKFLKMSLKEYLSIDISRKFKHYPKDSNKIIINEILKNEKDDKILMFILNDLTLEDFIDIFTRKKEFESYNKLNNEQIYFLKENFTYVESLLEKIYNEDNDTYYFSRFIVVLYNLRRFFFVQESRKVRRK